MRICVSHQCRNHWIKSEISMPHIHLPVSLQNSRIGGQWEHRPNSYVESLPLMTVGIKTYESDYSLLVEDYDLFQIQVILEGALRLSLPTRQATLQPGTGVIYRVGSDYRVAADGETRVLYITQRGDRRPAFTGESTTFECDDTLDCISGLLSSGIAAEQVNSWLIASLGESLIAHAISLAPGQRRWANTTSVTDEMVTQAQVILGANAHTSLTPQDLLKTIGMSYRHLARLFKEQTGRSPKRYQIEARIGYACRMLESGSMTVGDVSVALNFSSPQYFARQFRQVQGMAPCDYLAKHAVNRHQQTESDDE